jgi:kynurenine formamidase
MPVLSDLVSAVRAGRVEVIDLTAPLMESTPTLRLPEPFGNTAPFQLEQISRYDDRGPAWYWNNIHTGEHTGTHLDAPIHWVTGKDKADVSQIPVAQLFAPAAVIDLADRAAADADFLLEVGSGRRGTAPCPWAGGCSTAPAGTRGRTTNSSS